MHLPRIGEIFTSVRPSPSLAGIENMVFPREVVWLSGAPGAGKGTMNGFIMKERDIPVMFEVSSLLSTPEMKKLKDAGVLIGDK